MTVIDAAIMVKSSFVARNSTAWSRGGDSHEKLREELISIEFFAIFWQFFAYDELSETFRSILLDF